MSNDNLKGLEEASGEWYLLGFQNNFIRHVDGGHGNVEGVAQALKLFKRIFGEERYEGCTWRAAYLIDVPDVDVPINEEAADICAMMVRHGKGNKER